MTACVAANPYSGEVCGGEMHPHDSPTTWWKCSRCGILWQDTAAATTEHREQLQERINAGAPGAAEELANYDHAISELDR